MCKTQPVYVCMLANNWMMTSPVWEGLYSRLNDGCTEQFIQQAGGGFSRVVWLAVSRVHIFAVAKLVKLKSCVHLWQIYFE